MLSVISWLVLFMYNFIANKQQHLSKQLFDVIAIFIQFLPGKGGGSVNGGCCGGYPAPPPGQCTAHHRRLHLLLRRYATTQGTESLRLTITNTAGELARGGATVEAPAVVTNAAVVVVVVGEFRSSLAWFGSGYLVWRGVDLGTGWFGMAGGSKEGAGGGDDVGNGGELSTLFRNNT